MVADKTVVFKMKASPHSMERFQAKITEAKKNLTALQQSVYEAQEALVELQFVVETATSEESDGSLPDG